MQSHLVLVVTFAVLFVLSQPGEAFWREGRAWNLDNKESAKHRELTKASLQRRNDESYGYPMKLIKGRYKKHRTFAMESFT